MTKIFFDSESANSQKNHVLGNFLKFWFFAPRYPPSPPYPRDLEKFLTKIFCSEFLLFLTQNRSIRNKKSCSEQFLKFWFFAPRYPPPYLEIFETKKLFSEFFFLTQNRSIRKKSCLLLELCSINWSWDQCDEHITILIMKV